MAVDLLREVEKRVRSKRHGDNRKNNGKRKEKEKKEEMNLVFWGLHWCGVASGAFEAVEGGGGGPGEGSGGAGAGGGDGEPGGAALTAGPGIDGGVLVVAEKEELVGDEGVVGDGHGNPLVMELGHWWWGGGVERVSGWRKKGEWREGFI